MRKLTLVTSFEQTIEVGDEEAQELLKCWEANDQETVSDRFESEPSVLLSVKLYQDVVRR